MKVADVLFNKNLNFEGVKIWFGNVTLDINAMMDVWKFLNQEVTGEETPKEEKDLERAYKKEKDINAIKQAVKDRKKNEISIQEIIRLRDEENKDFKEIAAELGCSESTVQTYYYRNRGVENGEYLR